MANEFRTLDSHSAEYFGDTRCTAPALHPRRPRAPDIGSRRSFAFAQLNPYVDVRSGYLEQP